MLASILRGARSHRAATTRRRVPTSRGYREAEGYDLIFVGIAGDLLHVAPRQVGVWAPHAAPVDPDGWGPTSSSSIPTLRGRTRADGCDRISLASPAHGPGATSGAASPRSGPALSAAQVAIRALMERAPGPAPKLCGHTRADRWLDTASPAAYHNRDWTRTISISRRGGCPRSWMRAAGRERPREVPKVRNGSRQGGESMLALLHASR
jgi:hypothetical protein